MEHFVSAKTLFVSKRNDVLNASFAYTVIGNRHC